MLYSFLYFGKQSTFYVFRKHKIQRKSQETSLLCKKLNNIQVETFLNVCADKLKLKICRYSGVALRMSLKNKMDYLICINEQFYLLKINLIEVVYLLRSAFSEIISSLHITNRYDSHLLVANNEASHGQLMLNRQKTLLFTFKVHSCAITDRLRGALRLVILSNI